MDKWIKAKSTGATNVEANAVAGYAKGTMPANTTLGKITLEEAYALEGMDNHYFASKTKEMIDTAEKGIATPMGVEYMPDWQNRARGLELLAKTTGKMSPTKIQADVNIHTSPFADLTDAELDKIIEGEIISDESKDNG